MMQPADRAWLTLAGGVAAWDILSSETLSAAMDRYHRRWPRLIPAVIVYLAGHLLGLWPARGDPLHILTALKRPQP